MSNKLPDLETQGRIAAALEEIAIQQAKANGGDATFTNSLVVALIDGTAAGFKRAMKAYMQLHGLTDSSTAADITTQVTAFYNLLQKSFSWDGYVTFADPAVSSASTGTKGGDNAGLTCVPSTAEVAGQDDYAGLPLFACVDCNWVIDATGTYPVVQITAIDGVVGNFKRYDPDTFVGVLQMTGYHYYTNPHEQGNLQYIEGYRIGADASKPHCAPMPEAVLPDGTVRSWMVHGKYTMGKSTAGKATNCSGAVLWQNLSQTDAQTAAHAIGTAYSGTTAPDLGFLQIMMRLKYASLTLDTVMLIYQNAGWSWGWPQNFACQVAETGVKRFLFSTSAATAFFPGMRLRAGAWSDTSHSWTEASYSSDAGLKITAVESVTIDSKAYTAVYVDVPAAFDTVVDASDASKTTRATCWLWDTGSTDTVKGNDGALNLTDGRHACKLQGIEIGSGPYEVLTDTTFKLYQDTTDTTKYYYEPYVVKTASKQTSTISTDYASAGVKVLQPSADNWVWIKASSWGSDGVLLPTEYGASSSTYMRDSAYLKGGLDNTTRAWLALGSAVYRSYVGMSCLYGDYTPGRRYWSIGARLSPNGTRG